MASKKKIKDTELKIENILDEIDALIQDADDSEYEFDFCKDRLYTYIDELKGFAESQVWNSVATDVCSYDPTDDISEMEYHVNSYKECARDIVKSILKLKKLCPLTWKQLIENGDLDENSNVWNLVYEYAELAMKPKSKRKK